MDTTTTNVPLEMDPKIAEAIKSKILARRVGDDKSIAPLMKGYSKIKK